MHKIHLIGVIVIIVLLGAGYFSLSKRNTEAPTVPTTGAEKQAGTTILYEKSLDLSGQGLEKVPSDIFKKTDLESLDLSNNNLTGAIPAEIRFLENLRALDTSNNQMTGLPAELGQLSKLEILDVSHNKLTDLPLELGNLTQLKTLNLSGNDYSEYDMGLIRQKLPYTNIIIEK